MGYVCTFYISFWHWKQYVQVIHFTIKRKKTATFKLWSAVPAACKRDPPSDLLIAFHTDGRELAGRSFPVLFLQHEHLNLYFFSPFFVSALCHAIQDFQFTYEHMHVHTDARVHVAMCVYICCIKAFFSSFLPIGTEIPDYLGKWRRQVPQSCLLICSYAV